ncbi:sigma-54 dependent transcriptional regulator [Chitinivorax sp. B]|uniref:sigma-54 interaction domain-containing protein n=1 Tax=Chitinivorax sp. B TaxID=2502235 RepID=UPI0020178D6D|nr:sigma-54 dependent transcriptional regulator [Chitinivorax sp. B]
MHQSADPGMSIFFTYTRSRPASRIAKRARATQGDVNREGRFGCVYGDSPAMVKVFSMIERVAPSDATVLIVGESGSGKELVAQTIHERSSRCNGPYVAINCGALPASLIEAELFGYEKGAFTGAVSSHQGYFERASGGTLFLDEITEMPIEMQVRLLRVLETNRFTRVGGSREQVCDIRVIAATNRDPQQAVQNGLLREDILYRLAVFPLVLPPLRARGEDIMLLAAHFLEELNIAHGTNKHLASGVAKKLNGYHWPGNVRELKNCVQRAYILADTDVDIDTKMPFCIEPRIKENEVLEFKVGTPLTEIERATIFATLACYQGNKRHAAKALGVSLKTLYNKLNEYAVLKAIVAN